MWNGGGRHRGPAVRSLSVYAAACWCAEFPRAALGDTTTHLRWCPHTWMASTMNLRRDCQFCTDTHSPGFPRGGKVREGRISGASRRCHGVSSATPRRLASAQPTAASACPSLKNPVSPIVSTSLPISLRSRRQRYRRVDLRRLRVPGRHCRTLSQRRSAAFPAQEPWPRNQTLPPRSTYLTPLRFSVGYRMRTPPSRLQ